MLEKSMGITKKWVEEQRACGAGRDWFNKHFPDGGDIDAVLVMITQDCDADDSWVPWLMQHAKYNDLGWLAGLSVVGSIYLSGTNITALPDGLSSVVGSLDLSGTNITALPDGLSVGGSIYLSGTNITALPDGLSSVGGSLDLRGTNITVLGY